MAMAMAMCLLTVGQLTLARDQRTLVWQTGAMWEMATAMEMATEMEMEMEMETAMANRCAATGP